MEAFAAAALELLAEGVEAGGEDNATGSVAQPQVYFPDGSPVPLQ